MTEFITRNYGNESYEIIIKTDRNDHYRATEDFVRRLIDHAKNMTNADRIRAMSDEELAKWLDNFFWGHRKVNLFDILKWLQQPAEPPKEDA